jgi:carbonic anhydrase
MNSSLFRVLQRTLFLSAFFLCGLPVSRADTLAKNLAAMEAQSPIDIRSDNTYFGKLPPLQFTLNTDTTLAVVNNGSPDVDKTAVRANVEPGEGSLTLSGRDWSLAQFHFHTPSEHLLNGEANPMEMHLVFTNADDLLVVGRWVKEGEFNSALDPIFSHIPQTTDDTLHVDHFNLNALLPDSLASFRYSGSLTTPPFSDGVSWVDLAEPLYMSHEQINAFSSMFPEGDARDVQALNGRIILTDLPGFVSPAPEPETYLMLLAGLGLISFVCSRRAASHDSRLLI